jgi:CRISPR-associated endonuclease Cas1
MARRPNLAVVSTCCICAQPFHPYRGREDEQRVCSHRCASVLGTRTLQALRAQRAQEATTTQPTRRAKRRQMAETKTSARQGARSRSAAVIALPAPGTPPSATTEPSQEQTHAQAGQEWLAAGVRYERLATQLARRERGSRTLILAGYGASLRVERDALVVSEGHTHYPQTPLTHTLFRGMHDVGRIFCLNPNGSLSFPAVRWCAQQGIAVTLIDGDGGVLATLTAEAKEDVTLRRRQYLAASTGQDVAIARALVRRKLQGQLHTLRTHPSLPGAEHGAQVLADALTWLELPTPPQWLETLAMLRTYEGRAAGAYFAAWVGLSLRWAKVDARRVPPHWLAVRQRNSPLSHNGMPRHAVDPTNALLNYVYAVLESQTRQALTRQGFDLACGFLHADAERRDSLVYDLMECERGTVDGLVLDFLAQTTFHAGDFTRVPDGSCRLHPQLARAVVAVCRVPQQQVDDLAKWLRASLLASA